MFHPNIEMTRALTEEKQYKPLIIEGVVVDAPSHSTTWRSTLSGWLVRSKNRQPQQFGNPVAAYSSSK